MKISKLDAARRQLETAIRLYFNDADPVSVHTLARASHAILNKLYKKFSRKSMAAGGLVIKDKFKKEIRAVINRANRHFKYIDNNAEAVIDFNPHINEFYLLDACEKYMELTSEHVPYFILFRGWFVYKHPRIFKLPRGNNIVINNLMESYNGNKAEYFSSMLSAAGSLK